VGDKRGIRRYGHFTLPMEETLVTVAVDLNGLYALAFNAPLPYPNIGAFDSELLEDFWQAVAANCLCNLHMLLHYGHNSHHIAEAVFKATARALRMAVENDPRMTGVPSTKGTLAG
jgi:imidazoleglycerol-phosphate dehydratase